MKLCLTRCHSDARTGQTSGVFTTGYEAGYGEIVGQHQLLKIY